jgi:hypothetical protein
MDVLRRNLQRRVITDRCLITQPAIRICGDADFFPAFVFVCKKAKKAKGLPPGIAKNLARGKPLPPGIAKQYLPTGLRDLLPPPRGFERIIVDGKVLLVEIATRIVHDILTDIILH